MLILAILGSGGFFTLIQLLLTRYFKKCDDNNGVPKALKRLADRADEGDLNDSRIQLLILIIQ